MCVSCVKTSRRNCACQKPVSTLRLKCDGNRAENRFRLSAKRTSPFKSAGTSVQSTTGSRGVRISSSNVGYTMFRGSEKSTGYPLHPPVSHSLPLPCVTVCHHISNGLYYSFKGMCRIRNVAALQCAQHCHAISIIRRTFLTCELCNSNNITT
jgi:hypothetical protein